MLPQIYNEIIEPEDLLSEDLEEELPLLKEYDFNFETNSLVYVNGEPKIVEGLAALKVQNKKALLTDKFKFLGYSWNYGCELKTLVGSILSQAALESESRRLAEECLLVNPYNESISEVNVNINGKKVDINIKVKTLYGEVDINV